MLKDKIFRFVLPIGLSFLLLVAIVLLFLVWPRPAADPVSPEEPVLLFAREGRDEVFEKWSQALNETEITYQAVDFDFGQDNFRGVGCYVLQKNLPEAVNALNQESLWLVAKGGYESEDIVRIPFRGQETVISYKDFVHSSAGN